MHKYIHKSFIQTYMHTYRHAHILTYIHTYIHIYILHTHTHIKSKRAVRVVLKRPIELLEKG